MGRAFLIIGAAEAEIRRADNIRMRRTRYNMRTHARPLQLSDAEFMAHYRLSKDIFEELCHELEPLLPVTRRRTKISVACKVLIALSFYATGWVELLMTLTSGGIVKFMTTYNSMKLVNLFGFLDAGYPLRPWMLTPITNAELGSPEECYTNAHCRVRNCVERTSGVLKARCRCLLVHRVLHYDHNMVAQIINACVIVHNICNRHRLPVPQMLPAETEMELNLQVPFCSLALKTVNSWKVVDYREILLCNVYAEINK